MNSDQPQGTTPVSCRIPTNQAEAIFQLAQQRSSRTDKTSQSDLIRKYIAEGLSRDVEESEDVPEEVYDLLDDDLLANTGGDEGNPKIGGTAD